MPRIRASSGWFVAPVAIGVLLSGCFTSTADFREKAEEFIVDDPGIAAELGVDLVSATCDEPVDQNVGTSFSCDAVDANGDTWGFDVEIAESNRIELSVSARP
jgi:hypothetical protein